MPDCSPCGLAVDWSRRCYASEWHLFVDSPETTTPGRYYRPLPGTPFLDVEHHYGSREWYSTNWTLQQSLGEDLQAAHRYDKGITPEDLPDNNIIGSAACIAGGARIANALPIGQNVNGFDVRCFRRGDEVNRRWARVATFGSCSLQYFYARMIEFVYDHDFAAIDMAFDMLLPGGATNHFLGTPLYPDYSIVVYPEFCVVIIDGTDFAQAQQVAMQGFRGLQPPVNIGNYSTLGLWFDASSRVLASMEESRVNPDGRFMIVGHSYGGATMMNVVTRLLFDRPGSRVRYIGYGTPKPGDFRMARIVERARGLLVANQGDVVAAVPPNLENFFALMVFTGVTEVNNWAEWIFPHTTIVMDEEGRLTEDAVPILDFPTLATMLAKILASQPFDTIVTHFIRVYSRRIRLRCPDGEWPVSPDLWQFLLPPVQVAGIQFGDLPAMAQCGFDVGTMPRDTLIGEVGLGANSPFAAISLELGAQPSPADAGLDLGAQPSPADAGLELEAQPSPADAGLELGAQPSPADAGLDLGAQPSPADAGLDLGAQPSPADAGLDLGAQPSPADAGLEFGV
jgi:hypothetical protein